MFQRYRNMSVKGEVKMSIIISRPQGDKFILLVLSNTNTIDKTEKSWKAVTANTIVLGVLIGQEKNKLGKGMGVYDSDHILAYTYMLNLHQTFKNIRSSLLNLTHLCVS